jgi:hypothetical protein
MQPDARKTISSWPAANKRSQVLMVIICGLMVMLDSVQRSCQAETLRVTTWNLGLEASSLETDERLKDAAATLRVLHPDVVLLQEVKNWKTCRALTELLKPLDYSVLICSAFPGPSTNAEAEPQVAILARKPGYFTWTEACIDPQTHMGAQGGVAFAAIDAGSQRLGFFNSLISVNQRGRKQADLLLGQMDSVKRWETNQVQTFVVASSAGSQIKRPGRIVRASGAAFERAGLVDATEAMPPDERSTLKAATGAASETGDCLFAGPAGFPAAAQILTVPNFAHCPLTCEIDLDPQSVSLSLDVRAEMHRQRDARVRATLAKMGGIAAGVLILSITAGYWLRRRSMRKRVAARASRPSLPSPSSSKPAVGALRPIIFVDSASKPRQEASAAVVQPEKPVLRIQTASQRASELSASSESKADKSIANQVASSVAPQRSFTPLNLPTADPAIRRGVVQELANWLKHKFVRKLMSDREQMLQAHELATRMASTLDNRLARIEAQIRQQNEAYLRRIDELNRELSAAREENRELIRERIAQVKAEMEAARAKVLAEANLTNESLRL